MKPFKLIIPALSLRVSLFLPVVFLLISGVPALGMVIARRPEYALLQGLLSAAVLKWLLFFSPWLVVGGIAGLIAAGVALKMYGEKRMMAGAAIFLNTCVMVSGLGLKYSPFYAGQPAFTDNDLSKYVTETTADPAAGTAQPSRPPQAAAYNNTISYTGSFNTGSPMMGGMDEKALQKMMGKLQALVAQGMKNGEAGGQANSLIQSFFKNNAAVDNTGRKDPSFKSMAESLGIKDE